MTTVWRTLTLWIKLSPPTQLEKVRRTPAGLRKGGQWERTAGQAGTLPPCQVPQKPDQCFQEVD